MTDQIKRWMVWIALAPALLGFWGSVATVAVKWDTLTTIIDTAQAVDPVTGLNGLQEYTQLRKQHTILWNDWND